MASHTKLNPRKLHPRNQHTNGYDFTRLIKQSPELEAFTHLNPNGQTTVDFNDEHAVRALNQALLKTHYNIQFWDIPDNYLCPPIPGRVDYIHYLADLLASNNSNNNNNNSSTNNSAKNDIPRGRNIKVLDIGTGANLVYPLTGQSEYGWHFTGVDIDPTAIKVAKQLCQFNNLKINLKLQPNSDDIFKGVIGPKDHFHLTMCNPPFHSSAAAASRGTQRKWKNLGRGDSNNLNFGGQNAEIWCPGGEVKFIAQMIEQSVEFSEQCLWFTSLVSKKDNLKPLYRLLEKHKVQAVRTTDMAQGQKVSRFIAWSFMKDDQRP